VVIAPQRNIFCPDEKIVQHLIVGQENVGRAVAQGVLVADNGIGAHAHTGIFFTLPDKEARGHIAFEI
jgi:hypothetical protein